MNNSTSDQPRERSGFTLLEMLISVLIFSFVVIAIYYFFDSGHWLYVKSENRSNLQENARLTLEQIERDLRMAGLGVPKGTAISATSVITGMTVWLPYIFEADESFIGFRGDIDNGNSMLTADASTGSSTISVDDPESGCPSAGFIVVERGRIWQPYTCTSFDKAAGTIDVSPNPVKDHLSSESEIFSPEHVWYRLNPDADADGICDTWDSSNISDIPDCTIDRAELNGHIPVTTGATWVPIATNIKELHFQYFGGGTPPTPYTLLPLSTADLTRVNVLRIVLVASGQSDRAAVLQDVTLTTEILVRKQRF